MLAGPSYCTRTAHKWRPLGIVDNSHPSFLARHEIVRAGLSESFVADAPSSAWVQRIAQRIALRSVTQALGAGLHDTEQLKEMARQAGDFVDEIEVALNGWRPDPEYPIRQGRRHAAGAARCPAQLPRSLAGWCPPPHHYAGRLRGDGPRRLATGAGGHPARADGAHARDAGEPRGSLCRPGD